MHKKGLIVWSGIFSLSLTPLYHYGNMLEAIKKVVREIDPTGKKMKNTINDFQDRQSKSRTVDVVIMQVYTTL